MRFCLPRSFFRDRFSLEKKTSESWWFRLKWWTVKQQQWPFWRIQFAWSRFSCVSLRWFFIFYHGKWLLNHHVEHNFVYFCDFFPSIMKSTLLKSNDVKPDESWSLNLRKLPWKSPPKWYLFQRIFVCGDLPKETRLGFDAWWLVLFSVYHNIYIYTNTCKSSNGIVNVTCFVCLFLLSNGILDDLL